MNNQFTLCKKMEDCMKRTFLAGLFVLVFVGGVYGQTRTEHRWLIGTWTMGNMTVVFNENGTGRWDRDNMRFSIEQTAEGTTLSAFFDDGEFWVYVLHRINDRLVVLRSIYPVSEHFPLNRR